MDIHSVKKTSIIILFSLLAGALGGFVLIWGLLVKNLFGFAYSYPLLNTTIDNRPVTIIEPREVTIEYDVAVESILTDVSQSSALIFEKKLPQATVLTGVYIPSEAIGQASAVTSDGWFMTSLTLDPKNTVVHIPAFNNGNLFTIDKVIVDPNTDTTYFKLELSQEMRITSFADTEELHRGETVIISDYRGEAFLGSLLSVSAPRTREDLIRSSEEAVTRPSIAIPEGASTIGAYVYDTNGGLIAMTDLAGSFFYTNWENALPQVLRDKVITRPYLGIHYVLLSDLLSDARKGLPDVHNGAWILGDAGHPPVIRKGPAYNAGIVEGEIIISVERETVTKNRDIEMLIAQYSSGDTITITVLNEGGAEEERQVTLGSY